MEILILILFIVCLWLYARTNQLTERLELLEARLSVSDALVAPAPFSAPGPVVQPRPAPEPSPVRVPAPSPASPPKPGPTPTPVASQDDFGSELPAFTPGVVVDGVVAESSAESWELKVGTSWLNKIGVLTLVIGVALLVGYSFTQIGPGGRVAIGFVLSGGLLGTGVWLERRDEFRNYAYGLIGGGWAGVYFTTFAMHDVPAAKVIDDDLVAVSLLTLVASGMVAHSLKYRSQVVTSLAFVVAYATLALSPLSGFSLAASVPLAMSVLAASQRLGWPGVSVLGIAATYGVFVLRSEVYPGGAMDPSTALPYATLAAYWLTFEIADLIALRVRRREDPGAAFQVSMLALNAAGLLGSIAFISPGTHPELRSTVMFATGAAYNVSAVIRAWLLPERRQRQESDAPFDVSHAATAMASLLFAIGIALRIDASGRSLAWVFETQILFIAGLTLSDRWLRRLASIVGVFVTLHAAMFALAGGRTAEAVAPGFTTHAAIAIMTALIWYANREFLRFRSLQPSWLEPGYTWAAAILLATGGWLSLAPAHLGLAGWLLMLVLLEAGLRRDHDYTLQSYATGLASAYATFVAFLAPAGAAEAVGWGPSPGAVDNWTALPVGIAACATASWRLLRTRQEPAPAARLAAGVAATLALALTMVFEWRVLATNVVALAWALTAVSIVAVGDWKHVAAARWVGYIALLVAAFRQFEPLFNRAPNSPTETAAGALVIASVYFASYFGGRSTRRSAAMGVVLEAEHSTAGFLGLVATASFVLWKYRVLPEDLVGPSWALTGVVLAALGFYRQRSGQRWQGYALAAVAGAHSVDALTAPAAASAATAWGAAGVAVCVYATARLGRLAMERERDQGAAGPESHPISALFVGSAALFAALILDQAAASLVTLLLALEGLGFMAAGLLSRERVVRLSGLSLLLGCLLKVFLYDLRELDALPRIFSFVVLGLVLLGISWVYTRYREQIQKLL